MTANTFWRNWTPPEDDVRAIRGRENLPSDPHPVLGPSPCDACPQRARCAELRMCCSSFARFVDGDPWQRAPRQPSRRRYMRLYDDATVDRSLDDEREDFRLMLIACGGNIREAARRLQLRFRTAHGRARRWGLLEERRGYSTPPEGSPHPS